VQLFVDSISAANVPQVKISASSSCRNKIIRRGQTTQADLLSKKIGKCIDRARNNLLRKASASDTRQLWQMLRSSRNWAGKKRSHSSLNLGPNFCPTANDLNSYFAGVSTDPDYSKSAVTDSLNTAVKFTATMTKNFVPYTSAYISLVLSRIKSTAAGPDGIPYWLYKNCAAQLGSIVAKLINYSVIQSAVPQIWRIANITPVPKCSPVSAPSDLRPISVTSILSRTVERLIVRDYFTPLLQTDNFNDQYAYKPTGSTTCALIDFTHRIHTMLETNRYVRCVLIDFSKAFDLVDHAILIKKLSNFLIPPLILHWIVAFLSDRSHATRLEFKLSSLASFNRSIVQGSGIGPTLFLIFAADLKPLDILNRLLKYADDCTLLCPENSNTMVETEMNHVMNWARDNKMLVNLSKTMELVFHRPNLSHDLLPPPLPDIVRVTAAKLLGVHLSSDLKFTDHVSSILSVCNQRLYLLSQLKRQGLGVTSRDAIFQAIVVSRIMYALPVFYGYLSENDTKRILSVFAKARRWQLILFPKDFETMAATVEYSLFRQSLAECHCLHHLYTPRIRPPGAMVMRKRGHDFELPTIKYDFNKRTFIARALFNYR
jgi:hypothetical protein